MPVEHAVEVLVALAVVRGVVDRGVMIGVLLGGEQVQAVQDQRSTRTRQDRADVMACERTPESDRMQVDRAVAALMRLRGRDVIGPGTLALDAMEIDARTVTRADFGDRVRPVDALLEGGVRLHDRGARFALDHDEVARMRSEEHTSELQSLAYLVCRLLL